MYILGGIDRSSSHIATRSVAGLKGRPMAKIITRFFDSTETANLTRHELVNTHKVPPLIIKMTDSAKALDDMLGDAPVEEATIKEYKKRLGKGGVVMMVRAGYRPLGVARIVREVTTDMGAVDLPDLREEVFQKDELRNTSDSILPSHPRILTGVRRPGSNTYHMANWPIPLLSKRKPADVSIFPKHARMASWPIKHLAPEKVRYGRFPFDLLAPDKVRFGRFPFGLLAPDRVRYGKFPIGLLAPHRVRYGRFPIGLLAPHRIRYGRFPFGLLVPNHNRMANWPFPLLIDGKQGTNSLVPGHKYMAKFPFAHIVPGHKYMAKFPFAHIVPGHKYMARFPFGHIVPGHKFMAKFPFAHLVPGHKYMAKFPFAHIVPGHKYMANFIFPHTEKKAA